MLDYLPASAQQKTVYNLLLNGNLFNKNILTYVSLMESNLSTLEHIMSGMNVVSVSDKAILDNVVGTSLPNLSSYLQSQFDNITQNLILVTSYISDSIGYGTIGTANGPSGSIDDPTASISDYFGSLTGTTVTNLSTMLNNANSILKEISGLIALWFIENLHTDTTISQSVAITINQFFQTNPNISISNLDNNTIAQLISVYSNLSSITDISKFGQSQMLITNSSFVINVFNCLTQIVSLENTIIDITKFSLSLTSFVSAMNYLNAVYSVINGPQTVIAYFPNTDSQNALSAVDEAVMDINTTSNANDTMIVNEQTLLANAIDQLSKMADVSTLISLFNNDAANVVLKNIASPQLTAAIAAGWDGSGSYSDSENNFNENWNDYPVTNQNYASYNVSGVSTSASLPIAIGNQTPIPMEKYNAPVDDINKQSREYLQNLSDEGNTFGFEPTQIIIPPIQLGRTPTIFESISASPSTAGMQNSLKKIKSAVAADFSEYFPELKNS